MNNNSIIILDFGSQYTQLIARRIRELNVFSEIYHFNISAEKIKQINPKGIILSGGPASVYEQNAPFPDRQIFKLNIPILGLCYGLQIITEIFNGRVKSSHAREYGFAELYILSKKSIFFGLKNKEKVWMSHGDKVIKMPSNFKVIGKTSNSDFAAIENTKKKIYGLQFHPEVIHTENGIKIFENFIKICGAERTWVPEAYIKNTVEEIKQIVKNDKVLCAVSGGVDSTVTAVLVNKAIGKNLICVFVNNGLLRLDEDKKVLKMFKKVGINVRYINAENLFLKKLKGVTDPEKKRKIIGNLFIKVFENYSKKIGRFKFLAQGTLYPDLIESVSVKGPSTTIKSHHNVGGLPKKMKLKLIEPLKSLFKDEVRKIGEKINIPYEVLWRQPFPGPGLAVRIIGEITKEKVNILRKADHIIIDEIKKAGYYDKIWQSFGVLLPIKTVGVMGDKRTYENVIAIRAVHSKDGMTADWVKLPCDLLNIISSRIINEVKGVNRVVYDISNKPPSTIEWE